MMSLQYSDSFSRIPTTTIQQKNAGWLVGCIYAVYHMCYGVKKAKIAEAEQKGKRIPAWRCVGGVYRMDMAKGGYVHFRRGYVCIRSVRRVIRRPYYYTQTESSLLPRVSYCHLRIIWTSRSIYIPYLQYLFVNNSENTM